jgi:inositol-pentakisphosphate 2-kinase
MPKAGTSACSYEEIQDYWEKKITELFKEGDLVTQKYGCPHFIHNEVRLAEDINDMLGRMDEDDRRGDFRGSRVIVGAKPMELMDMRAKKIVDLVFEFKPKWLTQSPSAPGTATRCRNCAHEAYKLHKSGKTGPVTKLCPFKYVGRPSDLEEAVEHILHQVRMQPGRTSPKDNTDRHRLALADWLQGDNVLKRLRVKQMQYDFGGPLNADEDDELFPLVMTLRDCSCFLRVSPLSEPIVEARLGDLDRKNATAKTEYWRNTERTLIEGGFYEGKEQPHIVTNCVYGRQ